MVNITLPSQRFKIFLEGRIVRDHHLVIHHVTVLYFLRSVNRKSVNTSENVKAEGEERGSEEGTKRQRGGKENW